MKKVVVLRFGKASDPVCMQLDDIVNCCVIFELGIVVQIKHFSISNG